MIEETGPTEWSIWPPVLPEHCFFQFRIWVFVRLIADFPYIEKDLEWQCPLSTLHLQLPTIFTDIFFPEHCASFIAIYKWYKPVAAAFN